MARSGYSKGADANRYGSAEFMTNEQKEQHFGGSSGIHIGGNWYYKGQGHGMIVGEAVPVKARVSFCRIS